MNLLLSAYACDPANGSEPGVGWQVLVSALQVCDKVVLLTRSNNVDAILSALSAEERSRLQVQGFDLSHPWLRAKRMVPSGTQAYYLRWQIAARKVARDLASRHEVDIAHHATFAIDWMPTALDTLVNVPIVWGPVGGSSHTPASLLSTLGIKGAGVEGLRWLCNRVGRARMARKHVPNYALCVAQNDDVVTWLSKVTPNVVCEPNAFVDYAELPERSVESVDAGLLVGVGRLVPWKGWQLAIKSLAHLPNFMRLELIGVGPDERRLRRIAKESGVADRVVFRGRLPRAETLDRVAGARAMIFPSFHDSASTAMGEALALQCPVIALPLGGSGVMLRRSGSRPVALGPDLSRSLATAILDPISPTAGLWSSERLPVLLTQWYSDAINHSLASDAMTKRR